MIWRIYFNLYQQIQGFVSDAIFSIFGPTRKYSAIFGDYVTSRISLTSRSQTLAPANRVQTGLYCTWF